MSTVVAMNDEGQMYDYDLHDYQGRVGYQIDAEDLDSYLQVADELNRSRIQVVNIQHEYGLFGGEDGEYIVEFMRRLRKPIVLTMHTVLPEHDRSLQGGDAGNVGHLRGCDRACSVGTAAHTRQF